MRIRDPIHGTISVSNGEKAILDSPFYQRLRFIKQLGFGDLAFPGATHTRHAHSLGAMHVASRLLDAILGGTAGRSLLPETVKARFRQMVRLAALCHDLGHMPLSHASEHIAPPLQWLGLPAWLTEGRAEKTPQATHEDFTAHLLLNSSLAGVIKDNFGSQNILPEDIVALIAGRSSPNRSSFFHQGVDWRPLLRALVAGELDADRMDYLLRDSFYTGVNYGRYDLDWVVQNLNPALDRDCAFLAISRAAAFAFEDFLLSRYHMFVSVYYHHTTVNFDAMLKHYYQEAPEEFTIPVDPEAFLLCDDVALIHTLRASSNSWARRIVSRKGYKLLVQFTDRDEGYDLAALSAALTQSKIDYFAVELRSALSKYVDEKGSPTLYVLDVSSGRLTSIEKYTPLYQRYSGAVKLSHLYVKPEQMSDGQTILERMMK